MKILILASNPYQDLKLDQEIRELQKVIRSSRDRTQFQIVPGPGVRIEDLQPLLLEHNPQIVHFCGHGTGEEGLVLQDGLVPTDALAGLFRLFSTRIQCVLLNACYAEVQANEIVKDINYVIGMRQEILDTSAIAFASGFYLALGYGRPIEEAFEFGCNAIQLKLAGGSQTRSTVSEADRQQAISQVIQQTPIPEHLKPVLKKKPGLRESGNQVSAEQRSVIQGEIDRAIAVDSPQHKYREQVQEYLTNHRIEAYQEVMLRSLQGELGLSDGECDRILQEKFTPILQAQDAYRKRVKGLMEGGFYPFNAAIQQELKRVQTQRGLLDWEVEEILADEKKSLGLSTFSFEVVTVNGKGEIVRRTQQQAEQRIEDLGNGIKLEMVWIPGGTFLMGSPKNEEGRSDDEGPQHSVTIKPFLMGQYPITQTQWKTVAALPKEKIDLNPDPSHFKGANCPVEQVSWHEAIEFCSRLSRKTGREYRLPSEAEWEYACRAGTSTPFHFGETLTPDLANYDGNSVYRSGPKGTYRKQTTEVGSFLPNSFGLYDMHGNVWEWCLDHWHATYNNAPIDGSVWITGGNSDRRVLRGGSWFGLPWDCRSAYRPHNDAGIRYDPSGFRVCCVAPRTL
ncbi:MAG: SUMF1/EgtB/PvdO family nonheme iron enzyme, partial [Leptolyngbyaceae cyanobacterium bins.59]|nr:SUMF1/EgtB/PvdO family nonheme iron enzyme [Leptolyngbyaceae cyanobacterium bins.59]